MHIPFKHAYAQLPAASFEKLPPRPVRDPQLIRFNYALAAELNIELEDADPAHLAQVFAGNRLPDNAEPLAMAYCGHQFGQLNPQLGDGRAILLGDVIDRQGQLRDIQLKGSGRTPFSRGGDGRCPLGPALREYILCEAMHALGVPTTRALAVVASGEPVMRREPEPGAVFTRVAASHIRVGTLQYFALNQDLVTLQALADHSLERHYPELDRTAEDRYVQLFAAVCERQAQLIARWMELGFIHGVMNTDNMTLSGETIDYGPCAFMDVYRADQVYSSIDQFGRYAYRNQPAIGQWNLARLAEALLPLFPGDDEQRVELAMNVLNRFPQWQQQAWETAMVKKLGFPEPEDGDRDLVEEGLVLLEQSGLDYTLFWRRLSQLTEPGASRQPVLELLTLPGATDSKTQQQALEQWLDQWQQNLTRREHPATARHRMERASPALIPRNHRVAEAISAAEQGDYSVFETLVQALADPWSELPRYQHLQHPPAPEERILHTFCGT
ncbi:MAG: YdiU family protein [Pseudomonadota bacterium]|nr:hypothetical protein [Pseudomonadales bacterium]MDY6919264.1 YdiU family protein [Pseudomonadota bacterium]